jgi:xylulose-5-phosphate/fructose-6-phosphate phosphoketolase
MVVLNDLDRFHLVAGRDPPTEEAVPDGDRIVAELDAKLAEHRAYIRQRGEDMPEIRNWRWPG